MKTNNKDICSCLSKPDYHREDCPFYDIHGNPKNGINKLLFSFTELDHALSNGIQKSHPTKILINKKNEVDNTRYLAKFLKTNFAKNDKKILIVDNIHSNLININDLNVAVNKELTNRLSIDADTLIWKNLNTNHILNKAKEKVKSIDLIIFIGLESELINGYALYKNHDFLHFIETECYDKYMIFLQDIKYQNQFFILDQKIDNIIKINSDYSIILRKTVWDVLVEKCPDYLKNKSFQNLNL